MSSAVAPFATIEEAVEDIRNGKMVVVVDDPERENEGDLVVAAQFATPEVVNFMATHARGLICMPLTLERCQALGLPQMTEHNNESHETAFTISIDAASRFGVTTGISAADRAAFSHSASLGSRTCNVSGFRFRVLPEGDLWAGRLLSQTRNSGLATHNCSVSQLQ